MQNFKQVLFLLFLIITSQLAIGQRLELYKNAEKIKIKRFNSDYSLKNYLSEYLKKEQKKGFLYAGFDSIFFDTISQTTLAYYSKGEKINYGKINFYEDSIKINKFYNIFKENSFVNPLKIEEKFNKIVKIYTNIGYPFVSVKFDTVNIEQNIFEASVNIEKENRIFFDSIMLKGDSQIKSYYVYKILKIKKGELFSLSKLNNISSIIKNTNFLTEDRQFDVAFNDSICDILLYLKKRKASNFSGMLGILPNNKTTGKVLLTGDVNLYLLNILNFGEFFSLNWQKYEAANQFLNMELSFPYIFKTNFGLGAVFNIEKKDSICLMTDFTGKILYGNNFGSSINVFYRNISSFLLIDSLSAQQLNYSNNNSNLFGISYTFSKLNNNYNPQRGIFFSISSANGIKKYESELNSENNNKTTTLKHQSKLEIVGFVPIGKYFTIKLRSKTEILYSKFLFKNELYQIGGTNSIRGFDEKSFYASNYSFINFEFCYLFEEYSRLFAFYDFGYFEQRFTPEFSSNYVMGVGIGLDLKTAAGIFSVATAIGKQDENPFLIKAYKIHLGYKTYF